MRYFWCGLFVVWPIAAVVSCLVSPAMHWWFPKNLPSASPLGSQIDDLFYLIMVIVTVVFIGTQIALAYVLWHGSRGAQGTHAWFTHGSHNLEVIWTIVPSGILLFIALYQMDVWAQFRVVSTFPEQARNEPIAEVTARQFEWRIRYPAPGEQLQLTPQPSDLYTVNDLHVPLNKPVMIRLRSADVQHSFFVPEMRIKQDAVPGQVIPILFELNRAGELDLLCAELCGWGHYKMRGRVIGQSDGDFEDYLKELQADQWYDGVSKDKSQASNGRPGPQPALAQHSGEVQE